MNKILLKRVVWVLAFVFVLLCGTAFALMFRQTNVLQNQFDTAEVDCEVHEALDGAGDYTQGMQTADRKTGITVKNTGNIDAYLRVRFVSYWVNGEGNVVGKPSQMPAISVTDAWIPGSENTYYHKAAVAPEAFTQELLSQPIILADVSSEGYYQVVEVFADAIQSLPESAVESSWKVTVENELITTAP